jgi:hypothetical protein
MEKGGKEMKYNAWESPDVQPAKDTCLVAKLKDKDEFILVHIISDHGWLATPYLPEADTKYWCKFKELIDCWYDVREIGQY